MTTKTSLTNSVEQNRPISATSSISDESLVSIIIDLDDTGETNVESEHRMNSSTPKDSSTSTSVRESELAVTHSATKVKKKKSWVWLHFDQIKNSNLSKCKYCPSSFVISGTGTMSKHLYAKHSTMLTKTNQSSLNSKGKIIKPFKYNAGSAHDAFKIAVKIQKFVGLKSEVHQSKLTSLVIRNQIFRYLPVFYHTQSFLKDMFLVCFRKKWHITACLMK
ncbi:hypothetical protein GHT06_020578 [Daphnia sinensis]|uniref:BED-type domain-containing protein n=1 Tax=Daphnia sinensis TaxID=1820382 RepID=A0AAD5KIL1_9CRUS|nr:hypothetical protein GHT06_020578 [Daphnia sinensis]